MESSPVMKTFPRYLQEKNWAPILSQAWYLSISQTDKPTKSSRTAPVLSCIHILFPLNWDLKLSVLLGTSLTNLEMSGKLLFKHFMCCCGRQEGLQLHSLHTGCLNAKRVSTGLFTCKAEWAACNSCSILWDSIVFLSRTKLSTFPYRLCSAADMLWEKWQSGESKKLWSPNQKMQMASEFFPDVIIPLGNILNTKPFQLLIEHSRGTAAKFCPL